jgi:hypothetical protein
LLPTEVIYAGRQNCFGWFMPTAEYMREYRKRPGVRERLLREKREYDLFHRPQNRARWRRRNEERKAAKGAWYQRSAERIAQDRKTRRDYVAKFGRVPKGYVFTVADMAKALRTRRDPFASLRAAWKAGAKRGAKQGAATRKQRKAERALIAAYQERFGDIDGWTTRRDYRLMAKSLKEGVDHLADRRVRAAARENAPSFAELAKAELAKLPPPPPFSAKDELAYTRLIKNRKLFNGACELCWPEYFEYRAANKCARLTANDLRYAGQYTACAAPKR